MMNEDRLWKVLDEIRNDVKDLCNRMVGVEVTLENHLESQKRKFDKTTVVLGIVVGVIALVVAIK